MLHYATILLLSLGLSLAIIWSQSFHYRHTFDNRTGRQKVHAKDVPRVGGISIFFSVIVANLIFPTNESMILHWMVLTGSLAFMIGLAEDLTKRVSVLTRILFTYASGILVVHISNLSLKNIGIFGLNTLLEYVIFQYLFTAFAITGIAHAVNIIDGLNGLASGFSALCFMAIIHAASAVGDQEIVHVGTTLLFAVLGFWIVNWPLGKLFLGDGGSYFLGFCIAFIFVALVERNSEISPFFALLVCAQPVTEVGHSITRRWLNKQKISLADNEHMHSLIYKLLFQKRMLKACRSETPSGTNSLSGIFAVGLSLPPLLIAMIFYNSTAVLVCTYLSYIVGYSLLHKRLSLALARLPITFS